MSIEIWTLIILAATCLAIVWQANEARRAAKAAENSIRENRLAERAWVGAVSVDGGSIQRDNHDEHRYWLSGEVMTRNRN